MPVNGRRKADGKEKAEAEQSHNAADSKLLTTAYCHLLEIIRDLWA